MPLSDPNIWQEISKWLAGVMASLTLVFGGLLKKWFGDRFKEMDEQIDHVNDKANAALQKGADHDITIAKIETRSQSQKEKLDQMDDKLDRLLERSRG